MQDKRIDEQFINHAWQQMLVTLDQEIPTEKKRRRLVLVPWHWATAASILLLLSLGGGWWLSQQKAQSLVVHTTQQGTPENLAIHEDCPEAELAQLAITQTKEPTGAKESRMPHKNVVAKVNGDIMNPKQVFENQGIVKTLQSDNNTEKTLPKNQTIASNEIAEMNNGTSAASSAVVSAMLPIQGIDNQKIALLEKEKFPLEKKTKLEYFGETQEEKKSKDKRLNVGLELATYASAGAVLDGYAGGAMVEIPSQSEKINVRTGLNFNASQRYFDSNVPVAESDRSAGFGSSAVLVDPKPDLQVNAQQLSLPLMVEFKPRKSWGVEGGLQASYLLSARNLKGAEAYQTLAGYTNGNEAIRTFVGSLSTQKADFGVNADQAVDNSSVNISAFRRFDVAVSAGFGVYPTENLGVRLQYQRGLIDMLKADQFKTFGNNIRLSAVYFFK